MSARPSPITRKISKGLHRLAAICNTGMQHKFYLGRETFDFILSEAGIHEDYMAEITSLFNFSGPDEGKDWFWEWKESLDAKYFEKGLEGDLGDVKVTYLQERTSDIHIRITWEDC